MNPTFLDSPFAEWVGFGATVTSATILLFIVSRILRRTRIDFEFLPRAYRQQKLVCIDSADPNETQNRQAIWQFDFVLQNFDLLSTEGGVLPGFAARVKDKPVRFGALWERLQTEGDKAGLSLSTEDRQVCEVLLTFDYGELVILPKNSESAESTALTYETVLVPKEYGTISGNELHLLLMALLHTRPVQVHPEVLGEIQKLVVVHLRNQTGKSVTEFNGVDAETLVNLYALYLPTPKSRDRFVRGLRFVLPRGEETFSWDELDFIQTTFYNEWRTTHAKLRQARNTQDQSGADA